MLKNVGSGFRDQGLNLTPVLTFYKVLGKPFSPLDLRSFAFSSFEDEKLHTFFCIGKIHFTYICHNFFHADMSSTYRHSVCRTWASPLLGRQAPSTWVIAGVPRNLAKCSGEALRLPGVKAPKPEPSGTPPGGTLLGRPDASSLHYAKTSFLCLSHDSDHEE